MCDKRKLTLKEARMAVNFIKRNKGKKHFRTQHESRYYHCSECKAFHLTSTKFGFEK